MSIIEKMAKIVKFDINSVEKIAGFKISTKEIVKILENENKKIGNNLAAKIMADIVTYHTTPIEAAEIANQANVKHLVFYHLTPAPRNALMERMFVRGVNDIRKEWTLSDDGTLVILPPNSEKIEITKIN